MREKELRLALICYGGISLAVYMHGITKEIWRLARASRAYHDDSGEADLSDDVYIELLRAIEEHGETRIRVLVDIVAGASAGGINGIFLANAVVTGQSLEPLTDLWLETADVEVLVDSNPGHLSKISKFWTVPIAWAAAGRQGGTIERTVEVEAREEVKRKLANFMRARWFEPPFGGETFSHLLMDAFDAMASAPKEPPLLPPDQPLDLFVTVTDFTGHPERLRMNSPGEVVETEHRLILSFSDRRTSPRSLGDAAELVFAARATASFPGAFPPFTVGELDKVLEKRQRPWPTRNAFLSRVLPHQSAVGSAEKTVLIDGSVLANAPFRPAMEALRDRPARREIERRFVYIDPAPNHRSVRLIGGQAELPGFFQTIFGALSDIPREQPIRDNLEMIEARSSRIRRTQRIIAAIKPEVESAIETAFGRTLFLNRPTVSRLTGWRNKAQDLAARNAGYAYASYGHLKLSGVAEQAAQLFLELQPDTARRGMRWTREPVWTAIRDKGISELGAMSTGGASPVVVEFFRDHDIGFRIRRLRFLARELEEIGELGSCPRNAVQAMRDVIYESLAAYLDREMASFYGPRLRDAVATLAEDPWVSLEALAAERDLKTLDQSADEALTKGFAALPKIERRSMLLSYLGFPFYDIATFPLIANDEEEEFNPVKVDRIAPDDATSIREGGAQATLKGIQFNSFGAFFSRAYRENDYLWGRLHGADRLVDIVVSAMPAGRTMPPGKVAGIKRDLFRSIVAQERERLTAIPELFEALDREIR